MATLTIKNLPDDLYRRLKLSAQENRRSLNMEAIVWLEKAQQLNRPPTEVILAKAAKLREMTAHYVTNEEEIEAWINEGRE